MLRGRTRRDVNEPLIIDYFESAGCAVLKVNESGKPDLVVFKGAHVWLVEVKQRRGKLRAQQVAFQAHWRGPQVQIVRSVEDAAKLLESRALAVEL
jgi:Holliday junction resolvase-like predicted endonuclease